MPLIGEGRLCKTDQSSCDEGWRRRTSDSCRRLQVILSSDYRPLSRRHHLTLSGAVTSSGFPSVANRVSKILPGATSSGFPLPARFELHTRPVTIQVARVAR
jgi:hypothetical protein